MSTKLTASVAILEPLSIPGSKAAKQDVFMYRSGSTCLCRSCYSAERRYVGYGSSPEAALAQWQLRAGCLARYVFGGIRTSKRKANDLMAGAKLYL